MVADRKVYLGDGAYAEFTGYDVVISCDRENGLNYVHLDDVALSALLRYMQKWFNVEIKVTPKQAPEAADSDPSP